MSKIRLLALDVDGTLVNPEGDLTEPTRFALREAKRAGIEVVLATGRRYSRALPLVEPLEMEVPLVTASGALIKRPRDHRTLFQAEFAEGVLKRVLTLVTQAGYDPLMYADTFHLGFDYFCPGLEARHELLAEYYALNPGCERVYPQLVTDPPEGIFAGFVMGTKDEMQVLGEHLNSNLPGQVYVHVLRGPRYRGFMCEILPAGVSKWTGVLHLASQWGISAAEICAVGDDVNDIPMIAEAGLGVAMGNAGEEVKAVADRIAPCNNSDGLVDVVGWILE